MEVATLKPTNPPHRNLIMPINHDDEFNGPINEGNRYPKHWFFQQGEIKPDYPKSWQAAADDYEIN